MPVELRRFRPGVAPGKPRVCCLCPRRLDYRHFPTESDLLEACSTHYFAANPWPDLADWGAIGDPRKRLERALDELYAYYERTQPMLTNVLRDAELLDSARDAVAPLDT